METVQWVKEAAGHYFAKDGDWRVDYDIGGNLWQMRVRGLHVGNAHTKTAAQARIGRYDPQPPPEPLPPPRTDADAMAMLATVETAYLAPDAVEPGASYFVATGPKLADGVRQAVAHAIDEIGTAESCTATWVPSIRAWHVTLAPEAEWPVNALAELLYMHHVVVHKIAVTAVDTAHEPPHTETTVTTGPPTEETSVTPTKTPPHHRRSDATAIPQEIAQPAESPDAQTAGDAPAGSQTPQADTAPDTEDEFASLPPPIPHNPQDKTRDYRFDAITRTPPTVRKLAEESLAINAKRVARTATSAAERPRVNYHWDIQPVTDQAKGDRFKAAMEKYGKYRPAYTTIPFRAEGTPGGQITVRCMPPALYVTVDGETRAREPKDADPGFWGCRYSARPLEQRNTVRRLPGTAQ